MATGTGMDMDMDMGKHACVAWDAYALAYVYMYTCPVPYLCSELHSQEHVGACTGFLYVFAINVLKLPSATHLYLTP